MMEQLYFEEVLDNLFVSNTCRKCKNNCKVLCISEDAIIYCRNFEIIYQIIKRHMRLIICLFIVKINCKKCPF